MGRVLCAWEFGGDLGHIRRLTALARELKSTGHEPVLALSDLAAAPIRAGFEWHQAPVLAIEPRPDPGSLNPTDLLLHLGFSDAFQVAAALRGWRSLFDLVRPDVVVADYAPGALLAARAAGIARVNVGSGFSSPPPGEPMPAFRSWQPVPDELLRAVDARFLATMNTALAAAKARPLQKACEMFEADLDLLCTFAELDPFGPREGREYFGPLDHAAAGGARGAWRTDLHPRIFAYLKPGYRHLEALATALAQTGGESLIAAPGIDAALAARIAHPGLQVHAEPVDLETVLPKCDLCIGHSGSGFTARALAAGVPLGLLPMHLEQYLIARRAGEQRAAIFVNPEEAPDFALWLHRLAADDAMRASARALGAKYATHRGESATRLVAARIASLLGG